MPNATAEPTASIAPCRALPQRDDAQDKRRQHRIDGRNRLRACEIAGVTPTYQELNGHDPKAFIVSANLNRRNLSKGQQAMALAMVYPMPERGRGKQDAAKKGAETASFSYRRVQRLALFCIIPTLWRWM